MLLDRARAFQARVEGPVSGNVLLRRAQYRASEAPDEIVRSIVSAKIANQRAVLQRALRDHGDEMTAGPDALAVEAAVDAAQARILRRVAICNERRRCPARRGRRGGQGYFAVFDDLIRAARRRISASAAAPPPAARSGQRAAVVPLHAADP